MVVSGDDIYVSDDDEAVETSTAASNQVASAIPKHNVLSTKIKIRPTNSNQSEQLVEEKKMESVKH